MCGVLHVGLCCDVLCCMGDKIAFVSMCRLRSLWAHQSWQGERPLRGINQHSNRAEGHDFNPRLAAHEADHEVDVATVHQNVQLAQRQDGRFWEVELTGGGRVELHFECLGFIFLVSHTSCHGVGHEGHFVPHRQRWGVQCQ